MINSVSVYRMSGAQPAPASDVYLGEAVHTGLGNYEFSLPPSVDDYKFYYLAVDKAGNYSVSSVQQYWYGGNGLFVRNSGIIGVLEVSTGGVLKVRI